MAIQTIILLTGSVAAEETPTAELIEQAARGDATAQLSLAFRYRDGNEVKQDYAEAMRFGHLAADQGNPVAMDFVGWMYFRGVGVAHQPKLAFGWIRVSSNFTIQHLLLLRNSGEWGTINRATSQLVSTYPNFFVESSLWPIQNTLKLFGREQKRFDYGVKRILTND